ncbi:MAG: hypothetical protein HYU36_10400 [Planctomycetes bacterium]|nr:hypothetical protein [Planctomycetota bacterium]
MADSEILPEGKVASSGKHGEVKFDYIKSNHFRVIYADGVWGGLTPRLKMQITFWNERHPIPRQIVQELTEKEQPGRELRRESREAIVRELEASVIMDLEVARSFCKWLTEKIEKADQLLAQHKESEKKENR